MSIIEKELIVMTSRAEKAEALYEAACERADRRDRQCEALTAEVARLREALDLALACTGPLGVCDHCRDAIGRATTSARREPGEGSGM